ncbi:MAG: flagellar hook-length control protein FliK [Candidatus Binatia bacterium]
MAERQLEQAVGQAGAAAAGPARATIAERNAAAPRAGTPPPAHEGPATAVAAVAEPGTLQSGADRGAGGPAGDGAEHAPLQAASQPEPAQLVPAHGRGVAADSAPAVPARSVEPPLRDLEQLVALDQAHRPLHVRDTGGEMRVSVEPAGMGSVELRVSVQADAVHASFTASHEATRDALAQHRPQLEAALQRSQLKLEGFTVGLGQQHQPRDPGGQPDGRFLPPGGVPPGRPIDPVTVAPAPVPVTRGPGALSLRA